MKRLNKKQLQSTLGGVCMIPGNSQGGNCLPCAAMAAMGGGLGPGGAVGLICAL